MKVCVYCHTQFESKSWKCPECNNEPPNNNGIIVLIPESELAIQELGFPQETFVELFKLESSHFWFRARNCLIIWTLKKYFPKVKKMLELGCGTGYVLEGISKVFPGIDLTGNDISFQGLVCASERLDDAGLVQFNAGSIPYRREFDLIGVFDVLEHIENDDQVLLEINQALNVDGGLIITVPQHQFLWSQADSVAQHRRRYSAGEMKAKLSSAGFQIVRCTSFVTLLFPVMAILRLFARGKDRYIKDPAAELKINRHINRVFEMIMAFERLLIKIGINLPFGGSLLIILKKSFQLDYQKPNQNLIRNHWH